MFLRELKKASPIQEMTFVKHSWGKKIHRPKHILKNACQHRLTQTDLCSCYDKINKLEEETGMKTGFSFILPQNIVTSEQELSPPSETGSSNVELPSSRWLLVSPNKSLLLFLEEIKAKSERTKRRLLASADDRAVIMELTVDQHQSEVWYHVRQPRIAASRCKRCLLKPMTSRIKAIADVLNYRAQVQTQAMKDGIACEADIVKRYELITGNVVDKTGFCISSTHPFLGASPDGIASNSTLL